MSDFPVYSRCTRCNREKAKDANCYCPACSKALSNYIIEQFSVHNGNIKLDYHTSQRKEPEA